MCRIGVLVILAGEVFIQLQGKNTSSVLTVYRRLAIVTQHNVQDNPVIKRVLVVLWWVRQSHDRT